MENSSLIAKQLSGNLTPREKQVLDNWRQLDERNEQAFLDFEKIWKASGKHIAYIDVDTAVEWEKFKTRTTGQVSALPLNRRYWRLLAAAAALLVLVGLASVFFMKDPVLNITGNNVATATSNPQLVQVNSANELHVFYLPDSTKVFLNTNSSLVYHQPFMNRERRVSLEGEAYFEVTKNTIPFIVYAGETQVSVVGTAFNLKANAADEIIELTVVEGKVTFSKQGTPAADEIVVEQNEVVVFTKTNDRITPGKMSNTAPWWGKLKWGEKFDWTEKRDELFYKIRKKLR